MKRKLLWYKTCPFCHQGRLFVFKNYSKNKLYLHCEECERGYDDPDQLNVENSFLTLSQDFETVEASEDDLRKYNWSHLSANVVFE
jgi:hypothetical protein